MLSYVEAEMGRHTYHESLQVIHLFSFDSSQTTWPSIECRCFLLQCDREPAKDIGRTEADMGPGPLQLNSTLEDN